MSRALRPAWWAPLAAVLLLFQLALAVAVAAGGDDAARRGIAIAVALVSAGLLGAGLWRRTEAHTVGSALIVAGALLNGYWFWTLLLPVLAIVVIVGVGVSEVRPRTPIAATR